MPLMNEKLQEPLLKNGCLHVIIFFLGIFFCFLTTDYIDCHLNPARDVIYIFLFWVVVSTSASFNPMCMVLYGIIYDVLNGLMLGWTSLLWVLGLAILVNQKKEIQHHSLEKKWFYFSVYFFCMHVLNDLIRFIQTGSYINYSTQIQSFLFGVIFFPYVYNLLNKIYLNFDTKNG